MRQEMKLLWATGAFAALAGIFVGVLVIRAAGGPKTGPRAESVEVGTSADLREKIDSGGPVLFPDLAGGGDAFYVVEVAGRLEAVRAFRGPGTRCPITWDTRQERLRDCDGVAVDAVDLDHFELTEPSGAEEAVVVDPRHLTRAGGGVTKATSEGPGG